MAITKKNNARLSADEMEEMSLSATPKQKKVCLTRGKLEPKDGIKLSSTEKKKKDTKKEHPGFKAVEKKVEKEGYSKKVAGAIVASAARKASAKAHKANPRLNKVKGK